MPTISDYLSQLQTDKENLMNNLILKGVEASDEETFTTLVPKVNDIKTGGDIGEYFSTEITSGNNDVSGFIKTIIKTPVMTLKPGATSMSYMFDKLNNLTINRIKETIENLDTSGVTNMNYTLGGMAYLSSEPRPSLDLTKWDVSNVTTMQYLFGSTSSSKTGLLHVDVSGWNTQKVMDMSNMFSYNSYMTNLDLSSFDFSSCINVRSMFMSCSNLTNLLFGTNLGKNYGTAANYSNYELNLSNSNLLTHESLTDVIYKLYDLNLTYNVANGGRLYTQKLTLGSKNLAKLTAEEIAIATNKGWTVS